MEGVGMSPAMPPSPPPAAPAASSPPSTPPAADTKAAAPASSPAAAPKDTFETKTKKEITPRDGGVSGKAEIKTEASKSGEKTYGTEDKTKTKPGATIADV